MDINLVSDLPAWRARAVARVEDHFNKLALATLHRDLAALAAGAAPDVAARDAEYRSLMSVIEAAQTPAEISAVLSRLT